MRKASMCAAAGLILLVAAGCNTPGARIKKNQDIYDQYPPDVQAAIKSGQIQQGFDQTQAYLALGKPSRKNAAEGGETWLYTTVVKRYETRKKDVYKYEVERRDWEDRARRGEPVGEKPSMEETLVFHRTKVVRVVNFTEGRVSGWDDPTSEFLDEWH